MVSQEGVTGVLQDLISAVRHSYSGPAAKHHVEAISQYHRIQASAGFRAAAQYCLEQLRSWEIEAEIVSFPANPRSKYWTTSLFQEWEATEATLDLLPAVGESQRLADYREDKISLIQRSLPFVGEAEVAVLEGGAAEADYEGVDVAGKVVLAQGDIAEIHRLAIKERGAIGILFDGMREAPPIRQRIDLPDARQYTSFWWGPEDELRGFGFVLTPRQGDELRALARRQREKGQGPLRVRVRVVSRLYDGQLEVVSALIRGRTAEEVVVIAHLCHPQASANDNASGAAAALETARTLRSLIDTGRLPVPERSVRFLWVPEMSGTYAYLATHEGELARMVAGINLDMVGQNQAMCGSVFLIERPPEALASFAGDLAEALREEMQEGASSYSGLGSYPLYRQAVTPFSGGSDHAILSDPTVGVPTPMLIQWPDRFYHTSADTIDKVDAGMLALAGGLATAYAYFVAAAGEPEARWLAHRMVARAKGLLAHLSEESYTAGFEARTPDALTEIARRAERNLRFRAERTEAALATLLRLAPGLAPVIEASRHTVHMAAQQEWEILRQELEHLAQVLGMERLTIPEPPADEWTARARERVLRRLFRGPLDQRELERRLSPADQAALRGLLKARPETERTLPAYMIYWLDGQRNLGEIADLVECETGQRDVELMVRLADLLERAALLERVIG